MGTKTGSKGSQGTAEKTYMTQERASAIQSRTAKTAGVVEAGSLAARAARAAAHNMRAGLAPAPARKK